MYHKTVILFFLSVIPLNLYIENSYSQGTNFYSVAAKPDSNKEPKTKNKKLFFTIRCGQGGFQDERSPLNKLGGGQLTLDVRHQKYPIALSISGEYYTNSPEPVHLYEISDMTCVNVLYTTSFFKNKRDNFFAGGGFGQLYIPKSEQDPESYYKSYLFNLEAGLNYRVLWKFGLYSICKYLYARKKINGIQVIDFNEFIILIGITFNFSI